MYCWAAWASKAGGASVGLFFPPGPPKKHSCSGVRRGAPEGRARGGPPMRLALPMTSRARARRNDTHLPLRRHSSLSAAPGPGRTPCPRAAAARPRRHRAFRAAWLLMDGRADWRSTRRAWGGRGPGYARIFRCGDGAIDVADCEWTWVGETGWGERGRLCIGRWARGGEGRGRRPGRQAVSDHPAKKKRPSRARLAAPRAQPARGRSKDKGSQMKTQASGLPRVGYTMAVAAGAFSTRATACEVRGTAPNGALAEGGWGDIKFVFPLRRGPPVGRLSFA